MLTIFRYLLLFFRPPKKGDLFVGDAKHFVTSRLIEKIWFEMRNRQDEPIWEEVIGHGSYRLTLESIQPTYYIFEAKVLARNLETGAYSWLTRKQKRRIIKSLFHDLLAEKKVKKVK